jgi:uncharacterized protein with von Willebrand factor type A (vWA) domain
VSTRGNKEAVPDFKVVPFDVPLPELAASFSQRLHAAGVPVTPGMSEAFAHALAITKPVSRRRLYCVARAIFVTGFQQVATFNRVFTEVFGKGAKPNPNLQVETEEAPPEVDELDSQTPDVDLNAPREGGDTASQSSEEDMEDEDEDQDGEVSKEQLMPIAEASREEVLQEMNFQALKSSELASLYRLMLRLQLATPIRRTRRKKRGRRGEHIDMRRTLRKSLQTGGDPIRLSRKKRRVHPRRLVMLCDISGSMEPYARAYLQFLLAARATGPYSEAFVFATRLTRLTRQLSGRHPQRAIRRATEAVPDWSSGTRIGDALKTFNDRYGRRGMARGAVVVILSDGWERGDPELVAREMERLARLAYRIVWVNPRVVAKDFAPRAGGLVAALPYCDALVSGHSLKALHEVADAIAAVRDEDHILASWRIPSLDMGGDEEETWGIAGTTEAHVGMPSGYGAFRGNITP